MLWLALIWAGGTMPLDGLGYGAKAWTGDCNSSTSWSSGTSPTEGVVPMSG